MSVDTAFIQNINISAFAGNGGSVAGFSNKDVSINDFTLTSTLSNNVIKGGSGLVGRTSTSASITCLNCIINNFEVSSTSSSVGGISGSCLTVIILFFIEFDYLFNFIK